MSTAAPSSWLVEHQQDLPRGGRALDVACGRGRHALWLAARGFEVTAIDRDPGAISDLSGEAARLGLPVQAIPLDLERADVSLGESVYDVIVVVHYLHRPLFPALRAALRPGGVLVYETFTRAQARRGKPTNPDFLLETGELVRLVAPLEIVAGREGEAEGKDLASIVARRSG
jgi:SAM-dependent methyltransferase